MTTSIAGETLDDTHPTPRTATLTSRTASDTLSDTRFVTMKLPYDDAVLYAIAECQEWLEERGISIAENEADAEWASLSEGKAWYQGYYRGVRIDQAIRWIFRVLHESFAHNPYGLEAIQYWIILIAMLTFLFGNIAIGVANAYELSGPTFEVLRGVCAALPVMWMLPTFLFPALIANIDQQYAAMGLKIEED